MSTISHLGEDGNADAAALMEVLSCETLIGRTRRVCNALHRLAARKEIGGIPCALPYLFSSSPKIHAAACVTIAGLLELVPTSAFPQLYQKCQTSWSYWSSRKSWFNVTVKEVEEHFRKPIDVPLICLLTFHSSGYVREIATRRLEKVNTGEELRFLLFRKNDWVESVAEPATRILDQKLIDDYLEHFANEIDGVTQLYCVKRRDHDSFLNRFLGKLTEEKHAPTLMAAIRNSENAGHQKAHRRFLSALLKLDGNHHEPVCRAASNSRDFVCRLLMLESAKQYLPIEHCIELAESLAEDPFTHVREAAAELQAAINPESRSEIWSKRLLDKHRSLRTTAQFHLKKSNVDVASYYRQTLQDHPESFPALCGLIECGDVSDLNQIRGFLDSPLPSRRAEAIRGVGQHGTKTEIRNLLPHLIDLSPRVVRAAAASLSLQNQSLDTAALASLAIQATSSQTRKSIVWLLGNMDRWQALPEVLQLAAIDDELLRTLAEQQIEQWLANNQSFLKPSRNQKDRIESMLDACANKLSDELQHSLSSWLRPYGIAF